MKSALFLVFSIVLLITVYGCEGVDLSEVSEDDINKVIVCESPYIRHASGCCLDQDNNDICDNDEGNPVGQEIVNEIIEEVVDSIEEVDMIEEISTISTCTAGAPIICADAQVTSNGDINLVLSATEIDESSVLFYNLTKPSNVNCAPESNSISTSSLSTISCTVGENLQVGDRYSGTGTISYKIIGGVEDHTTSVLFEGNVE